MLVHHSKADKLSLHDHLHHSGIVFGGIYKRPARFHVPIHASFPSHIIQAAADANGIQRQFGTFDTRVTKYYIPNYTPFLLSKPIQKHHIKRCDHRSHHQRPLCADICHSHVGEHQLHGFLI